MSKVLTCLCMIMLALSGVAAADEVVSFTAVPSQGASGLASYTATLTGGFTLGSIDWDGFATPINTGTYGSELTLDISGPLGSATIQLGSGTTYAGGAAFSGSDGSFAYLGDPAGVWTFDFYETYDDGSDGLPDSTWDNIDFTFAAPGETVCFTAVDSQATSGLVSYTATLIGGFNVGNIDWDGFASTISSGTYGSELTCAVSGPLGSVVLQLGSGTTYSPGAQFTGSNASFVGAGDPAGVWTFDFYETYDDSPAGDPDATWDDICFTFGELVGCFGPDTCVDAEPIGPGTLTASTTDCSDAFSSYSLWGWSLLGNDHVYVINVPCAGSEVCVTLTPLEGQDPAVAMATACTDGSVVAIAGADNGLDGDAESFCYTLAAGEEGDLYIYCDFYGAGAGGEYQLDVTVTSPVPNDTCETAIDVTGGGLFSGSTACAANDYDGSGCIPYASTAPDVVYAITVNDGDTVDILYTPIDLYDPSFYVVGDCSDIVGTCMGGADSGVTGDPESDTITFDCAGTYYIICDAWSTGEGAFDLDVTVTPAAPVDTFDVSMVCDPDPLTLPVQTKIRVYVTNTVDVMRQYCGNVGVTLCNGTHISNLRAGSMVLAGGETKYIGWGQRIPALATTCDCTLVFDVDATDCTPCESAGAYTAGWTESASCGITTVCP